MAEKGFKRKLAAILSADVEGYRRLKGDDKEAYFKTTLENTGFLHPKFSIVSQFITKFCLDNTTGIWL